MGTISYKDLEVLALIAKLPQHDVLYHSQKLTTAISRENLPLAQNAIDLRLGGSPRNPDENIVRMAKAIIDWGELSKTELQYNQENLIKDI